MHDTWAAIGPGPLILEHVSAARVCCNLLVGAVPCRCVCVFERRHARAACSPSFRVCAESPEAGGASAGSKAGLDPARTHGFPDPSSHGLTHLCVNQAFRAEPVSSCRALSHTGARNAGLGGVQLGSDHHACPRCRAKADQQRLYAPQLRDPSHPASQTLYTDIHLQTGSHLWS